MLPLFENSSHRWARVGQPSAKVSHVLVVHHFSTEYSVSLFSMIHVHQLKTIKEELGDKPYAIVFDGTPSRGEVFGMAVRFWGTNGEVRRVHRVIAVCNVRRPPCGLS